MPAAVNPEKSDVAFFCQVCQFRALCGAPSGGHPLSDRDLALVPNGIEAAHINRLLTIGQ